MIPQTQLDELRKLHKDHIANTFLFTSKVLDQRRHLSDAQAEVIHGLLHDLETSIDTQEAEQDPAMVAQNAMRQISEKFASQSARSIEFFKETVAAYAEFLRLAMNYSADTFVGRQTAAHDAWRINASTMALCNPWMEGLIGCFEDAAHLIDSSLKPVMKVAETSARAASSNGRSASSGKANR